VSDDETDDQRDADHDDNSTNSEAHEHDCNNQHRPPHLSSASALPCERGNPEDSALCVQHSSTAAALSTSFILNHVPNSSKLNALITIFRESHSSVSMSRESKKIEETRMWADAQPDGRPAQYRWRPVRKFLNSIYCTTP